MKKFLFALLALALTGSTLAAPVGGAGVSGLRTHDHSSAGQGGVLSSLPIGLGADLIHLQTQAASGAGSIDFANIFSSSYDVFWINMVNVVSATDNQGAQLRFSVKGSTCDSAASYAWASSYTSQGAIAHAFSDAAGIIDLTAQLGTDNSTVQSVGVNGSIQIINKSGSWKSALMDMSFQQGASAKLARMFGSGVYQNTTRATGFCIVSSSGLLTGTVSVYGYRKQ